MPLDISRATPIYKSLKKALDQGVRQLGAAVTIGMVTTTLLRLHTDRGRPARFALQAMAGALADQTERVSLEDIEHFYQMILAIRRGDTEALEALDEPMPDHFD